MAKIANLTIKNAYGIFLMKYMRRKLAKKSSLVKSI